MTEPSGKDLLKYGFQVARAVYARKLYSDNDDQLTILHKSNKAIQIVSGSITLGASVTDQNVVIHEGTLSTQNIIGTTLTDNYSTLTQGSITNVKYFQSSVGSFTTLYGDGSNLTGLSGGDHIFEGDTKVETIDSGSDGYIKFITDNSEKMRIDNNGYVGIGTTGPDRRLDILDNTNPQLRLTHTDGSKGTDLQSTSDSLLEISPVGASTANSLRVNSNDATCRMYMKGSSGSDLHIGVHSGGNGQAFFWNQNNSGIEFGTNNTERMCITNGGNVGIGTSSPGAPLHVAGYVNQDSNSQWNFLKYGQNADGTWIAGNVSNNYGLWVDNFIHADAIVVSSDERVKKDIVDITDATALEKIRLIKPKTFKYIDQIENGDSTNYGFIAQDVSTVLPNCVDKITKFIPNFFTNGTITRNISSGILEFTTTKNLIFNSLHDSNGNAFVDSSNNPSSDINGNKIFNIKLISENNKLIKVKTKSIINSNKFTIENNDYETTDIITEGKYFLYGQEVDDYHNLNQDMIYTVCVAAVQEIDRQQILDKIEINNLKIQYNDLLARVTALENN